MKKVFKNRFFWVTFVLVAIIAVMMYYTASIYLNVKGEEPVVEKEQIKDTYKTFVLYSDSSEYQNELFEELKENDIDEGASQEDILNYVTVYSKNYIADYLTLNVKNSAVHRIGGKQFLYEEFQEGYDELPGISDYYFSKKYYVKEHEDTYKDDLPEITNLTLVESNEVTFDFYDATNKIEQREDMEAYELLFDVEYKNNDANDFTRYASVSVIVVNWDGFWTVVELKTDSYSEEVNVISIY